MIIPYSTDAPIYHPPIATVTLIVLNVLCYFTLCRWDSLAINNPRPTQRFFEMQEKLEQELLNAPNQEEQLRIQKQLDALNQLIEPTPTSELPNAWNPRLLILEFGHGLRPWQWLTNMFMHADLFHLIGNMTFLWAFGLVVEGKLGNFLFAAIYLGMGIVQSVAVQSIMIFSEGGALGASGAIFALMALVVIFAPVNSFDCFVIFVRIFFIEVPILAFGAFYLALNLFFFFLSGGEMSSEALHLAGFGVGLPVGFFLLKRGLVDCEGYDIVSYFRNERGRDSKIAANFEKVQHEKAKRQEATAPSSPAIDYQSQVDLAIAEGNFQLAAALQNKLIQNQTGSWSQKQLQSVIQGLWKQKNYAAAEPLLEKHIELFETYQANMQILLIKLWLQNQRPRHALRYMQGLNPAFLQPEQNDQLQKLTAYAEKQIASGVIELEPL